VPPERVVYVAPVYPPAAKHERVEGKVVLDLVVGVDGDVAGTNVVGSNPVFDGAAVEAVKRWKYRPATRDGRPVEVVLTVTVEFSLDARGKR
jgi:protein TonB